MTLLKQSLVSKKGKRKVVLTQRDKKLFYFLFRFKIVDIVDVQNEFFRNVHYSALTRRLRVLESAKFIQRYVAFDDERRVISTFTLSPQGLLDLQKAGIAISRKQLKSNYPDHDLKLLKVVRAILRFEMMDKVITENELLSLDLHQHDERLSEFIALKPDAVLMLNVKGAKFHVALEFEQNGKSAIRWKQKLLHYYQSPSVDAVFYVCESLSILNKLIEIDREIATTERRKIFFALSKNVTSQTQKVTLINSASNTFTLN